MKRFCLLPLLIFIVPFFTSLHTKVYHSRIMTSGDNADYCCGGYDLSPIKEPKLVMFNVDFSDPNNEIVYGCLLQERTMLLSKNGSIFMYGDDHNSGIPDSEASYYTPTRLWLPNGDMAKEICCATYGTFAITQNEELLVWGYNYLRAFGGSLASEGFAPTYSMTGIDDKYVKKMRLGSGNSMVYVEDKSTSEPSFYTAGGWDFGLLSDGVIHGVDVPDWTLANDVLAQKVVGGVAFRAARIFHYETMVYIFEDGSVYWVGSSGINVGCPIESFSTGRNIPTLIDFSKCNYTTDYSELAGVGVLDWKCFYYLDGCMVLGLDGSVYSYSDNPNSNVGIGRDRTVLSNYVAAEIDMTNFPANFEIEQAVLGYNCFQLVIRDLDTKDRQIIGWGSNSFYLMANGGSSISVAERLWEDEIQFLDDGILLFESNGHNHHNFFLLPSKCSGLKANDSTVCNSHGECVDYNVCDCVFGWHFGDETSCNVTKCYGILSNVDVVCGGIGTCDDYETCNCPDEYNVEPDCTVWMCGTERSDNLDTVCSGNGMCSSPEDCVCNEGYEGDDCGTVMKSDVEKYLGVMVTLPVFAIVVLFCCVALCLLIVIVAVGFILARLALRVRTFQKLENFDILLQEQMLEKDAASPNLKIKVNKDLFEIDYEDLELIDIIGSGGSSAVVYRCKYKGTIVAFKRFKSSELFTDFEKFKEFEREVEILSSISHTNILLFIGACVNPPSIGIILEFCEKRDIMDFLKQTENRNFKYSEKLRMMSEISRAMQFLHKKGVIHRDLKSANVLLTDKLICKVMDFGLSRVKRRIEKSKTKGIGTSVYMAPEITRGEDYDDKVDVFSMGIMIWEITTQNFEPYEGEEYVEFKVANNPFFRPNYGEMKSSPKWLRLLCKNCLEHEAKDRPSFTDVRQIIEEETDGKDDSPNRIIYVRLKEEENNQMEDLILDVLTVEGVIKLIKSEYRPQSKPIIMRNVKFKIFLKLEEDEEIVELEDDNQILGLTEDSIVIIEVLGEEVEEKDKSRKVKLEEKLVKLRHECERTHEMNRQRLKIFYEKEVDILKEENVKLLNEYDKARVSNKKMKRKFDMLEKKHIKNNRRNTIKMKKSIFMD